jgi:hypothetical protein
MAPEEAARTYKQLAIGYGRLGDAPMRDRFLVLAADAWHAAGKRGEAEQTRHQLLQANPHHLLKPYDSLGHALESTDVRNYVEGLRRHYPPEQAAKLLRELGAGGAPRTDGKAPAAPGPEAKKIIDAPISLKPEDSPAQAAAQPAHQARRGAPDVYALMPEPASSLRQEFGLRHEHAGSWFCMTLFWLGLIGSLAWAGYSLARPFWR